MDRSSFIKNFVGAAGISMLPVKWVKTYDKFYLLQCFVAGFKYYEGNRLLENLEEGDMLQLVREPDNEYDDEAIALHWNRNKLGFIPARVNTLLARLIDIQALELHAEITHIKKQAKSWENIAIAIYCLKERPITEQLPAPAQRLKMFETPRYYSIKSTAHTISRIDTLDTTEKIVINVNKLPPHLNAMRNKYGAAEYRPEDEFFPQSGIRIIDDEDVHLLMPQIKEVVDISDSLNQHFTEMILDFENVAKL